MEELKRRIGGAWSNPIWIGAEDRSNFRLREERQLKLGRCIVVRKWSLGGWITQLQGCSKGAFREEKRSVYYGGEDAAMRWIAQTVRSAA